jgi:hypothetical protein
MMLPSARSSTGRRTLARCLGAVRAAGGALLTLPAWAAEMNAGETFAVGDNYAVQKFADNCTLSADLGDAVIGVSRDKEKILSLFFSSRLHDLSTAQTLTLAFGGEPPLTLPVARIVTVSGAPVVMLDIPSGIGRLWRGAATLGVASEGVPLGAFAMGEAQTEAPDVLQACVDSL